MTRLRIAYSCHDAFPSTDTNTQQIFWTLSEVARRGVAVDLLVPALRVADDARAAIARHYGAPDDRLPDTFTIVPVGGSGAPTTTARGWFDLTIARRLDRRPLDLLWTRDLVAAASAVRAGLPTVFETYRPDVATAAAFGLWRAVTLRGRSFRGVISHSRLTRDAFVRAGVPAGRALLAHNGYAPSLMMPVLTRDVARRALALPLDRALVVYTGHVGPKKGIDSVIRLAARLPEAAFVIVGVDEQTPERHAIDALAAQGGAANLVLVPRVPLAAVSAYLYAADVLIVPPTDEPLRRFGRTVLPMKIFSYLGAGRPIVAPDLEDVREVLRDGDNACLVSPTDSEHAADRLRALLGDRTLQERLSAAALASARGLTWAARAERIENFLDQLVQDGPSRSGSRDERQPSGK